MILTPPLLQPVVQDLLRPVAEPQLAPPGNDSNDPKPLPPG